MTQSYPGLTGEFRRWWQTQRQDASSLTASCRLILLLTEFLVGFLPSERRQRYGDIDYDWERRVNTTGATVSWRTRLLGALTSPYQPIPPAEFHEIMAALPVDFSRFTFIDIGSGKGRALLLAAEYGFRRSIGVELLPELHQAAEENIRQLQNRSQADTIELVCSDAAQFRFPTEPSVIFLFNPLPLPALRRVIGEIKASLQSAPRSLYVVYANPVHLEVFANLSLVKKTSSNEKFALFSSA